MPGEWYYTHDVAVHGPVSGDELRQLVVSGRLLPGDLIWPNGFEQTAAVSAEAALCFPVPTSIEPAVIEPLPVPGPSWLPQLANALAAGERPRNLVIPSPESWLSDVRSVEEGARETDPPRAESSQG